MLALAFTADENSIHPEKLFGELKIEAFMLDFLAEYLHVDLYTDMKIPQQEKLITLNVFSLF